VIGAQRGSCVSHHTTTATSMRSPARSS
jgi:hypothetical protein